MKNLITTRATTKATINPIDKTESWAMLKSARYLNKLQTEAATIVGIARKKENSIATTLEAPKSIAPIIVAADLEVPGIIDKH